MMRGQLTFANVTSVLALTVALGGTSAYAAGLVTSGDIKNGTVQSRDIKNRTIKQKDVRPGGLGSPAIRNGSVTRADLADAVISDVEWVVAETVASSTTSRGQTAACPAGKYLIGATAEISGASLGTDMVALASVRQAPDAPHLPRIAVATAHEVAPTNANWTLKVTAICAHIGEV